MNKITMYMYLCYISLALCLICFVVAIVLFFYSNIRGVIGYLTGRSARREIKALEGERTGIGEEPQRASIPIAEEKGKESKPPAVEKKKAVLPREEYEDTAPLNAVDQDVRFVLEREIMIIHTDEKI